jgi:hypothetical protein
MPKLNQSHSLAGWKRDMLKALLTASSLNAFLSKCITAWQGSFAMSIDPREVGPKPPFPKQEQTHPGTVK